MRIGILLNYEMQVWAFQLPVWGFEINGDLDEHCHGSLGACSETQAHRNLSCYNRR